MTFFVQITLISSCYISKLFIGVFKAEFLGDFSGSSPNLRCTDVHDVPLGSTVDPVLFDIFVRDLFLFNEEPSIVNYADGSTPCIGGENSREVNLENAAFPLFNSFMTEVPII